MIAPKVVSTSRLDKLTSDDKLELFIMFSLITAITRAPDQGDIMMCRTVSMGSWYKLHGNSILGRSAHFTIFFYSIVVSMVKYINYEARFGIYFGGG